MILPNTFALNVYAQRCRTALLESAGVAELVDLSEVDVFAGPSVRSILLFVSRDDASTCSAGRFVGPLPKYEHLRTTTPEQLAQKETWRWAMNAESPLSSLVDRLVERCPALSDFCDVRQGYIPYRTTTLAARFGAAKAAEIVKTRAWHTREPVGPDYLRELQGADVGRYRLQWSGVWVRYGEWVSTFLPVESVFSGPRILLREITGRMPRALLGTYTDEVYVHNPSVLAVLPKANALDPKCILGMLDSRLVSAAFTQLAPKASKGLFPKVIITDARCLPFPRVDVSTPSGRMLHDSLVDLVNQLLSVLSKIDQASVASDTAILERHVAVLDGRIDQVVYELYGLTDDEIALVESGFENG
jgi:hypothetical protein